MEEGSSTSKRTGRTKAKSHSSVHFHRPNKGRRRPARITANKSKNASVSETQNESRTTLLAPSVSEASMLNLENNNTIVQVVDINANKTQIKEAFQRLYYVKVSKVTTQVLSNGTKKAFIKLDPQYDALDIVNRPW